MTDRIVIVGDLPSRPNRLELLELVREKHPSFEWEWVQCDTPVFGLPKKPFNRLLAQLRDPPNNCNLTVVKLSCLNGRETNQLYKSCSDPILAPPETNSIEDLLEWLLSEEAKLVKEPVWTESCCAAAMIAILAKLIRNKSWNNSLNGHAWTQEADLLGQSPVNRPDGLLLGEANDLLERMKDVLLLTKGGKQGTTKKEWCIYLKHLPRIKQVILGRSLQPFRETDELSALMRHVDQHDNGDVVVDGEIVNERVRYNCRPNR